jgi:hypothetical protein
LIQDQAAKRNVDSKSCSFRFDCCGQDAPRRLLQQYPPTADIGCLFDHLVGERKQLVRHRRPSALAAFKLTASPVAAATGARASLSQPSKLT